MDIYAREDAGSEYNEPQVKKVKTREKWFGIVHFEKAVAI